MKDVLSIGLPMPAMQAHDLQPLRTILLYGSFWLDSFPRELIRFDVVQAPKDEGA